MAEFKSEWKGLGREGKDLGSDQDLMEVTDEAKKAIRLFMMQTRVDEPVWLRTMQGVVMEEMGALTPASARRYRLLMQNTFGLIKSFKEEGSTRWLVVLTDRGVDFVNWLIQDPDGQKWGIKSSVDLSAEEQRRYEEAFIQGDKNAGLEAQEEGGAGGGLVKLDRGTVRWQLGRWGLLLDDRVPRVVWGKIMAAVQRRGYRTVFVPDGYEVYILEMDEETGKRKAHRIQRWSDFPLVDRQLMIDAEIDGTDDQGREDNG